MQETVSDDALEDQWGVHSLQRQGAAYLKERLLLLMQFNLLSSVDAVSLVIQ